MFNIRKATENDIGVLNKMYTKLLENERQYYDKNIKEKVKMTSYFDKRINKMNCLALIAEDAGNVIGYIYGYIDDDNKIKMKLEAHIESIYVEKNYRNNKIGTLLITSFKEKMMELNVKFLYIDNKYLNETAKHLYEKQGFNVFIQTRRMEL